MFINLIYFQLTGKGVSNKIYLIAISFKMHNAYSFSTFPKSYYLNSPLCPWDALGGRLKSAAFDASMRGNLITNVEALTNYAKKTFKSTAVELVTTEDIKKYEDEILKSRFQNLKHIPGTLGYHSYKPNGNTDHQLNVRSYSSSPIEEVFSIKRNPRKQKD